MFRWVAKLECQNSRLYQVIATLYSKPEADLDTFSRVALKSDGVDFMYCIAYMMKIPSQPPNKPQLTLQLLPLLNMLNYFSWMFLKKVVLWSLSFLEKRRGTTCTDEVHFKTGQHGKNQQHSRKTKVSSILTQLNINYGTVGINMAPGTTSKVHELHDCAEVGNVTETGTRHWQEGQSNLASLIAYFKA